MIRDATQRQRVVYEWMLEFQERHGMPPTLREICERFEYRSTNSAGTVLDALQKKGLVESSSSGRARGRRAVAARDSVILALEYDEAFALGHFLRSISASPPNQSSASESAIRVLGRFGDRIVAACERHREARHEDRVSTCGRCGDEYRGDECGKCYP